ncbi:hypothetical protein EGW08_022576, partial [Elysia chlorotica]
MKVNILQIDIVWENKAQNYKNLENKISKIDKDVDLIVLPEMFNTGFMMNPKETASHESEIVEWMYNQVKNTHTAIVGSAAIFVGGEITNRLYFVTHDKKVYTYDKNHLFIHAGEGDKYTQGHSREIIKYKGFKILLTICFDLRFPVFNCNDNEYDILLNVACWPESRRNHWKSLLIARAIENQVYVIACNRVGNDPNFSYAGDSMIIDYNGDVIAHADYQETILISKLD